MEDYFERILNLAWQLRQHLAQFIGTKLTIYVWFDLNHPEICLANISLLFVSLLILNNCYVCEEFEFFLLHS
jgi:hypothetical protein